jgi:hypothetical protein
MPRLPEAFLSGEKKANKRNIFAETEGVGKSGQK